MASNRLWVGGFDRPIEKAELCEVFSEFGPITDVWLAFNPPGYAFIEFEKDEQAQKAMVAMNQTICLGCKITVQTSKKSGYQGKLEWDQEMKDKVKGSRIYIGNIVEKINVGQLNGAFEEFGNIVDISVNKEGFAFVEFEQDGEAARAVEETNGTEIFGGFLEVEITAHKGNHLPGQKKYLKQKPGELPSADKAEQSDTPLTRLFLGNLNREVTKDEMSTVFEDFGKIKEIWVPYTFKGYCFLEYEEEVAAKKAVEEINGTTQDFSDSLKVEITARKKPEHKSGGRDDSRRGSRGGGSGRPSTEPRLFVGNIKEEIEKTDLKPIFEPYGEIVDIWVAYNPPGFAFVQFKDMESAQKAIKGVHDMEVFGGKLKVDLTNSKRKGEDEYPPKRPYHSARPHPYARPGPVAARRPPPFRSFRGRAAQPAAPHRPVRRYTYHQDPYYAAGQEYADPYYAAGPAPQDPYYYDEPYYRPDPLNMRSTEHPVPVRRRGRGVPARGPLPPTATSTQIPYSEEYY